MPTAGLVPELVRPGLSPIGPGGLNAVLSGAESQLALSAGVGGTTSCNKDCVLPRCYAGSGEHQSAYRDPACRPCWLQAEACRGRTHLHPDDASDCSVLVVSQR